ncbi:hypothetical protein NOR_04751 [Metarhizium rileyi]|uniref:Uncharacterized protein n=1 Tax=Metarhizium rileyi (strain RCEF 4871) TaxID=1649241 RepID=A0A167DN49_METRR|nr:hypothetical protein NOR_04751 [Metarhizium rileyi RCEF 4871]
MDPESDEWLLMDGCYSEAERSDDMALKLEGLRIALNEPLTSHLGMTIKEITRCARRLRELADIAQVKRDCVAHVLHHLNVVLPCMCQSLQTMRDYYLLCSLSKKNRWRSMYHDMKEEANGLPLHERFHLYYGYVTLLRNFFTRCPPLRYEMEMLECQLMDLREARDIEHPCQVLLGPLALLPVTYRPDPISHWAENVFSPGPRTPIKNTEKTLSLGPNRELGHYSIPVFSKVLFRQSFDKDAVSLTAFLNSHDNCAYLLLRMTKDWKPWFSIRGVHELCIRRRGSSLELRRWSLKANRAKPWAILGFNTWEGIAASSSPAGNPAATARQELTRAADIAIMYCTFMSLKAKNRRTVQWASKELALGEEHKLFQTQILDDGKNHLLTVYKDKATGYFRLHAAVHDGELRQCPVWTAFVTEQPKLPNWLTRNPAKRKVWLSDIQLFVFCKQYREENQHKGPAGQFQIHFAEEGAAESFEAIFYPPQHGD